MNTKRRYSGEHSVQFWRRVNKLHKRRRRELYSLGCVLQDVEERVLHALERVEEEEREQEREAAR